MLLAVLSSLAAFAGVGQYRESDEIRINEICTANLKSYISPEGEAPDWIELYNAGERDVDLSGYVLSKTNGKKNSFVFPKAVIKGGGYLIVPLGEEQEEVVDPDASFSLTSFLLTGKAVPVEKKLAC
ncbi:MAG: lamin tail domain-containing protein, partial [Lachnospiraceae bacterium]|nr:lamin tail domain-containing protein [Lachnospiraceae bacterium]